MPTITTYQQDAEDWLRMQPNQSLDLLIMDPAYESLEKHRAKGTTTRLKHSAASSNDWFQIWPNSRYLDLFIEAYRALANNSHMYVMCDQTTAFIIKPLAEQAGFTFWKALVWDKCVIGMGYHYRARHEFVLFLEKGKRKLSNLAMPDILAHKRVRNGYPTEKPAGLYTDLIQQSSSPGETVGECFYGSGTGLVTAAKLGRHAVGCDISPSAQASIKTRAENVGIDLQQH